MTEERKPQIKNASEVTGIWDRGENMADRERIAEYLQRCFGSAFSITDFKKLHKDRRNYWLSRADTLVHFMEGLGYTQSKPVPEPTFTYTCICNTHNDNLAEYCQVYNKGKQAQLTHDQDTLKGGKV